MKIARETLPSAKPRGNMATPRVMGYGAVSAILLTTVVPGYAIVRRRYGIQVGRRFWICMGGTLTIQQLLVCIALLGSRDAQPRRLTFVDLITLSRGGTAALLNGIIASGVRDRRGSAGWMAWLSILYGAIACDWLDGPIARRLGTSQMGAMFDVEADSWLTLCTGCAAVSLGKLPAAVVAPPLLRYAFVSSALRRMSYRDLFVDEPAWVRRLGIIQMLLFIAALAPFGGRATKTLVNLVTPIQTPLQIGGLILLHRRRRGRT